MNERRKLLNPKDILSFPPGKCILISPSYSDWRSDNANQNTVRVGTGVKNYLGDPSCAYNARSKSLRCAVNPSGPCSGCSHYAGKNLQHQTKASLVTQGNLEEEILALAAYAAIIRHAIGNLETHL
jgi:Family of unknown function (DUF6464)